MTLLKKNLFVTAFLIIISAGLSCSGRYEYYELEAIAGKAGRGDFSALKPLSKSKLCRLLKTDEASIFCLGIHLAEFGAVEDARFFFSFGAEHCKIPFSLICKEQLYRLYSAEEKLEFLKKKLERLEAKLSKQVLTEDVLKNSPDIFAEITSVKKEIEEMLFCAGRFAELEKSPPELYASVKITAETAEAYSEIMRQPRSYPEDFYKTMEMRLSVFEKRFEEAWRTAAELAASDSSYILSRNILSDIGRAALYGSKNYAEAASVFEQGYLKAGGAAAQSVKTAHDFKTVKYMYAFYAGRLYAKAGKAFASKAEENFKLAEENAVSGKDADNAVWHRLNSGKKNNFGAFITELINCANSWHDPYWFEDLILQAAVTLISAKDFQTLKLLAEAIEKTELAGTCAALAYILARSDYLTMPETEKAYKLAYEKGCNFLYYRLLAADKLNLPQAQPFCSKRIERESNPVYTPEQAFDILNAHVRYGLHRRLYTETLRLYPHIKVHEAEVLAKALAEKNMYADSIKIMTFAVNTQDSVFNENHLRLIYPRPWLKHAEKWAKEYNLPEYLLYALIRSESYFKLDAVSHAGAEGLSQLMPSTAADIAKKLKLKEFNLTDPDVNIRFGAYYLSEMIRRNGAIMPALASYNAGITAVRRWQKNAPGFPPDLFLEVLPYAETRGYVKNILTAAVIYGTLYYGKNSSEIIREIFPSPVTLEPDVLNLHS